MPVAALQVWLLVQALAWTPWLLATAWFGAAERPAWWAELQVAAMVVSYAALVLLLRAGRRAADVVTIGRFAVLLLAVVLADRGSGAAWWLAVAAVLGDLVDGAVARRLGGSPQGAVLDMEADQLTVLALASMVVAGGGGSHVLVLPGLRYLFVLWMRAASVPAHDPKPKDGDNRRGRRVCAAVLVALLFALSPSVPRAAGDVATGIAVALLLWSFGDDAKFLLGRRSAAKGRT